MKTNLELLAEHDLTVIEGWRRPDIRVTIDGQPLPLYEKQCHHSPTGFEWGYGGSGPAQLAFAILYHLTRDQVFAAANHQQLKWAIIRGLPEMQWKITGADVREALEANQ